MSKTLSLEDFNELKKKVQAAKEKEAQAKGSLATWESQLKKLGYDNVEEAKADLEKLEQELEESKIRFEKSLESYKEKWGKILNL